MACLSGSCPASLSRARASLVRRLSVPPQASVRATLRQSFDRPTDGPTDRPSPRLGNPWRASSGPFLFRVQGALSFRPSARACWHSFLREDGLLHLQPHASERRPLLRIRLSRTLVLVLLVHDHETLPYIAPGDITNKEFVLPAQVCVCVIVCPAVYSTCCIIYVE